MAAADHLKLECEQPQAANVDRIRAMSLFFLHVFRHEHPIDKAGAAETVLATLIGDNARNYEDAMKHVDGVSEDIRSTLRRTMGH